MQTSTRIGLIVLLSGSALLAGCPASTSGGAYSREQARTPQEVQLGIVESVREVQIEGTKTPIGPGVTTMGQNGIETIMLPNGQQGTVMKNPNGTANVLMPDGRSFSIPYPR